MRIRLESVGCRLNIAEIELMGRSLRRVGHRLVGSDEAAELCIVNSCTVTAIASRKSRQLIRQLRRCNPGTAIVVTGCDAEMSPAETAELGVDLVVGNSNKERLLEILSDNGLLREVHESTTEHPSRPDGSPRTRAFLKVQDGCDNRCAYCVVTIARGPARSRPAEQVIEDVLQLIELGYREIVLSGVHLGSYGHDAGDRHGLQRLAEAILERTTLPRLRLSSLEPWDVHSELLDLLTEDRLLPHLHLPLQSGCEATLRRMRRRTTHDDYSRLLQTARSRAPGLSVSTDIMVGFPGEDDQEFEQSIAFVERMAFSRLHVFRFSARPGTEAAILPDPVPTSVVQQRSRRMLELGARLEHDFRSACVGSSASVLWETADASAKGQLRWSGLTERYVRAFVHTTEAEDLTNRISTVEVTGAVGNGVTVRLL